MFAVKHIEKSILKRKRTMNRSRTTGKMTYTTAFDKVEEEVAIMKKLEHENLVRLHEVMDDDQVILPNEAANLLAVRGVSRGLS